jgi:geranylgeranyl pyrophosphate synthase
MPHRRDHPLGELHVRTPEAAKPLLWRLQQPTAPALPKIQWRCYGGPETLGKSLWRKTGALLGASVMMGAACGAPTSQARDALAAYGDALGLAFQVVDDILDVTQASEVLGKTAGKDQDQNKPTYVSLLGLDEARALARRLREQALEALAERSLGATVALRMLADRVVDRSY